MCFFKSAFNLPLDLADNFAGYKIPVWKSFASQFWNYFSIAFQICCQEVWKNSIPCSLSVTPSHIPKKIYRIFFLLLPDLLKFRDEKPVCLPFAIHCARHSGLLFPLRGSGKCPLGLKITYSPFFRIVY